VSPTLLFFFQIVILVPFAAGTLSRRRLGPQPEFSRRLVRLNLIAFEPLIVFWATWGLELNREQFLLPLAGFAIVAAGFFFGRIFAPMLGLSGARRRVFLISASLGNHGFTLCASLCYLWLGEEGLGLAAIFTFYFTPYIFLFIFPYARGAAPGFPVAGAGARFSEFLRGFLSWNYLPLYATVLALLLLFAGLKRPLWDLPIVGLLVPTASPRTI
jgi:predicted permease